PACGVATAGVYAPVHAGAVPVDIGVGIGVAGRLVMPLDQNPVHIAHGHVLGGEVVVGNPAGFDHHQLGSRHSGRDVAAGPGDQTPPGQFGVQGTHVLAHAFHLGTVIGQLPLERIGGGHHFSSEVGPVTNAA